MILIHLRYGDEGGKRYDYTKRTYQGLRTFDRYVSSHHISQASFDFLLIFSFSLFSNAMIKTARDFELPDVDQQLAQLKVEVSLPSSQIGWIDEDRKKREKRRRVRRQHACETLTSIISNCARHHYHVHHSFFSFHLANHHLRNLFDSIFQYAFLAGKMFDHSLQYIRQNLFHHPFCSNFYHTTSLFLNPLRTQVSTHVPTNLVATSVLLQSPLPAIRAPTTATSPVVNHATMIPTSPSTTTSATTALSSTPHPTFRLAGMNIRFPRNSRN